MGNRPLLGSVKSESWGKMVMEEKKIRVKIERLHEKKI